MPAQRAVIQQELGATKHSVEPGGGQVNIPEPGADYLTSPRGRASLDSRAARTSSRPFPKHMGLPLTYSAPSRLFMDRVSEDSQPTERFPYWGRNMWSACAACAVATVGFATSYPYSPFILRAMGFQATLESWV